MKKLWFKNKRYGWGWTPATWEGWAVLAVYIILVFKTVSLIRLWSNSDYAVSHVFLPSIAVYTAILLIICYRTGEKPRWRWGGKD